MAGKKRSPVAACTKCGELTGHVAQVGRRCYRVIAGARCRGTLRGLSDPDEWDECPSCAAAGWNEGEKCGPCNGHGWLHAKPRRA